MSQRRRALGVSLILAVPVLFFQNCGEFRAQVTQSDQASSVLASSSPGSPAPETEIADPEKPVRIFVDPLSGGDGGTRSSRASLQTLREALSVAKGYRAAAVNVEIILADGVYAESDLTIDGSLSGSPRFPLTIHAAAGARPRLSGSRALPAGDWRRTGSDHLYWRPLPEGLGFRELFRDGKPLLRARQPNIESWQGHLAPKLKWTENSLYQITTDAQWGGLPLLPAPLLSGHGISDVEAVIPIAWGMSRLKLIAAQPSGATLFLSPRPYEGSLEHARSRAYGGYYGEQHFYLEGSYWFADSEGEWAIDPVTRRLYLFTATDPNASTFSYPGAATLLTISGASHVLIEGLGFEMTSYADAETYGYVSDGSGCARRWGQDGKAQDCGRQPLPGAVELRGSSDVSMTNATFTNIAASALAGAAVRRLKITDSRFENIGAAGVLFYGADNLSVERNRFSNIGFTYASDALTLISSADGQQAIAILDNRFEYLGGRAIYLIQPPGLMFPESVPASVSRISRNIIDNALNIIQDAGAINAGFITGLQVTENTIRNVYNRQWNVGAGHANAIYLDVGSYRSEVRANTVQNVDTAVQLNCQFQNTIEGNSISGAKSGLVTTSVFCLEATPPEKKPRMQNILSCGKYQCM